MSVFLTQQWWDEVYSSFLFEIQQLPNRGHAHHGHERRALAHRLRERQSWASTRRHSVNGVLFYIYPNITVLTDTSDLSIISTTHATQMPPRSNRGPWPSWILSQITSELDIFHVIRHEIDCCGDSEWDISVWRDWKTKFNFKIWITDNSCARSRTSARVSLTNQSKITRPINQSNPTMGKNTLNRFKTTVINNK